MAVVLIVEDEEQIRVLAEAIVRELGHETLTAGTAEQALAVVSAPTSTCSSPISACSRTPKPDCSSRAK
jgi:CheY-like chemotaxis protein